MNISTRTCLLELLSNRCEMTRGQIVNALGMSKDKIRLLIDSGQVLRAVGDDGVEWLSFNREYKAEEVAEEAVEEVVEEAVEEVIEREVIREVVEEAVEEVVEETVTLVDEMAPSKDMLGRAKAAGVKEGIKIGERKMLYKMSRMVHIKLLDILLDEKVGIDERFEI
jgi:predicted ArsR family transcriptional regulator